MELYLSPIDEARFGHVIAKGKIDQTDDVDYLILEAGNMGAELLIVRLPTSALESAHRLERHGALLMDTLVYFKKQKLIKREISLPDGYSASYANKADAEAVGRVSSQAFTGYSGHYHADSRLKKESSDAVYESWAHNSCLKPVLADEVILIRNGEELAAFATLKAVQESTFEGVLYGVHPKHRRKGLHHKLMLLSEKWGVDNNFSAFISSTQIHNIIVQKNWCRFGMEPFASMYTYHLWLKNDTI